MYDDAVTGEQVGGYLQSWKVAGFTGDIFTFLTVHGAGHMVP